MSLRDIFKDRPPVVSTSSKSPWPPPEKSVSASSSSQHAPFLTSSPLYSFKRIPTLHEFLNPNYHQKHGNDAISEPSVLLSNKNTGLSKADLDLQLTSRGKASKTTSNTPKIARKSLEKTSVKALSSEGGATCSSDAQEKSSRPRDSKLIESKTRSYLLTKGKGCGTSPKFLSSKLIASDLISTKSRAKMSYTVDNTSAMIADAITSVVKEQEMLSSRKQDASTAEDASSDSVMTGDSAVKDLSSSIQRVAEEISSGSAIDSVASTQNVGLISSQGGFGATATLSPLDTNDNPMAGNRAYIDAIEHVGSGMILKEDSNIEELCSQQQCDDKFELAISCPKQQKSSTKATHLCSEAICDSVKDVSSKEQCSDTVNNKSLGSKMVCKPQTSIIKEQQKLMSEKQLSNASTENRHFTATTTQSEETLHKIIYSHPSSEKADNNDITINKEPGCTDPVNQMYIQSNANNTNTETGIQKYLAVVSDPGKIELVEENDSCNKRKFDQMEEEVAEMEPSPKKLLILSNSETNDSIVLPSSKLKGTKYMIQMTKTPSKDSELIKSKSVEVSQGDDAILDTGEISDKHPVAIRSSHDLKSNENDYGMDSNITIPASNTRIPDQEIVSSDTIIQKDGIYEPDSSKESTTTPLSNHDYISDVIVVVDDGDQSIIDDGYVIGNDHDDTNKDNDDLVMESDSSNADCDLPNYKSVTASKENSDSDQDSVEVLVFKDDDDDDDDELEDWKIESDDDENDETALQEPPSDLLKHEEDHKEKNQVEVLVLKDDDELEDGEIKSDDDENAETDLQEPPSALLEDHKEKNQLGGEKKWKRKRKGKQGGQKKRKTSFTKPQENKKKAPPPRKIHTRKVTHPKAVKSVDLWNLTTTDCNVDIEKPSDKQEHEQEEGFSLLSSVSNIIVDVTVAASEKELIKKKTRGGKVSAKKRKKLQRRNNEYNQARREEKHRVREPIPNPVCHFYLRGACKKGAECQFRHEGTVDNKIHEVCKYYIMDMCVNGDDCRYLHHTFPCKFHHSESAYCRHGNHCKFSHDALTPETKELLDKFLADNDNSKYPVTLNKEHVVMPTEPSTPNTLNSPEKYSLRSRSIPKIPIYGVRYGSGQDEDTPKISLNKTLITEAEKDESTSKQEPPKSPNTMDSPEKYGLRNRSIRKTLI